MNFAVKSITISKLIFTDYGTHLHALFSNWGNGGCRVEEQVQGKPMNPDEILDIIRVNQCELDRMIANLRDHQTFLQSSSVAQPGDYKINHYGVPSTIKAKVEKPISDKADLL